MPRLIWINGRMVPEGKAFIPTSDSAYLYGHGVFETLRAIGGRVLFLKDHLERMRRNVRRLGLKIPIGPASLSKEILRTLRKNRLQEASIRMMLSESEGAPILVIRARPYEPFPKSFYRKGIRTILVREVQADSKTLSRIKTASYLTKLLARREAERRGATEGILMDERGHVTEGASSNLFIVKGGRLFTPPVSEGLLPGIRRSYVLKLARKLKIPCSERPLTPPDLEGADEFFITSTLKDILPVRTCDGKRIGKTCPGPVTRRLTLAYWEN